MIVGLVLGMDAATDAAREYGDGECDLLHGNRLTKEVNRTNSRRKGRRGRQGGVHGGG